MSLFRYGRDYYTEATAQQLLAAGAWLLVALVGIFIAAHLLRRSAGYPVANDPAVKVPEHARLKKYEIGARLYHWGNALVVLALGLSSIALFAPGSLGDWPWFLLHEIAAVAFILLLALHIVVAPRRGEGRSMWFERRDARDLGLIARNF